MSWNIRRALRITPSADEAGDLGLLQRVIEVLKQHQGPDVVHLTLDSETGPVMLEIPDLSVSYSPELRQQLEALSPQQLQVDVEPA